MTDSSTSLSSAVSYEDNYLKSTKETLVGLYSKRDKDGQPTETVTDIVNRVATSNAIAEVKYLTDPETLITLTVDEDRKSVV